MKNKLYTSINEFKQYLIKPINEGQFSWYTQDTYNQIGNHEYNMIDVYMHDNKGNTWFEPEYEGYGEFGGKDYYELLAEMNGYSTRAEGIDLAFTKIKTKNENGVLLFPALVEDENYDISTHDFGTESKTDPDQGWLIDSDEDEDDDNWDDEDENDEEYYESNNQSDEQSQKAILCFVYRYGTQDTTANGLSSKKDQLMLVDPEGEYTKNAPFNVDDEEDYLVLMRKSFRGKPYMYAVPKSILDEGARSMFGGNFLYSSDSRFPYGGPIKIHDRVERR